MELWNDGTLGFLEDIIRFSSNVKTIMPLTQHSSFLSEPEAKSHFSNIPTFQHSNWGEAPNLSTGYTGEN